MFSMIYLHFFPQDSVGIFVHPSGIEQSLHQSIDVMARLYGDKQGKQYRIWVDRVSSAQIGSDVWLVKFDKWELTGESCVVLYIGLYSICFWDPCTLLNFYCVVYSLNVIDKPGFLWPMFVLFYLIPCKIIQISVWMSLTKLRGLVSVNHWLHHALLQTLKSQNFQFVSLHLVFALAFLSTEEHFLWFNGDWYLTRHTSLIKINLPTASSLEMVILYLDSNWPS